MVSPLKLNSISDLNAIDETRTARELATNRGAAAATNFRSDPLNAVWEPEKLSVALANVPATLVSDTDRSADTTTRPAGSAAAGAARSRAAPFEATPMTAAPAAAPAADVKPERKRRGKAKASSEVVELSDDDAPPKRPKIEPPPSNTADAPIDLT